MKAYSQFERTVIETLIDIEKQEQLAVLRNIIEHSNLNFPREAYIDIADENNVTLYIRENAINNIAQLEYQVSRFIIDVIQLFQYLEEQSLIFLSERIDNLKTLGVRNVDSRYHPANFIHQDVMPRLYKYSKTRIFTTESLRSLVIDNYKTKEEIRHQEETSLIKKQLKNEEIRHQKETSLIKKQLKIAYSAVTISFLGLLASTLIPVFSESKVQITEGEITTKLNDKSISNIEKFVSKKIEPIASNLNKLQQTFEHYTEQAVTAYATNKKLSESIKELAKSINNTKQTKLKKMPPHSETKTQARAIKPRDDG